MCGIAGIYNFESGDHVDEQVLNLLNRQMFRRGPEKSGFWYSKDHQIGLAHNRLSFIDLHHRSDQPMHYGNGRYAITYNGEIYNYRDLRDQLVSKGYLFVTQSDTEVIMALYDCFGADMLLKLRGMFAFSIWDDKTKLLFAARDPFGIKPFYYFKNDRRFIFASQVKAISNCPELILSPSQAGWYGFFRNGSIPEPFTAYNEIHALPAGHFIRVEGSGKMSVSGYFSIYDEFLKIENTEKSKLNFSEVTAALEDSISHHLVADVPVGLFLSSGIDSTIIANSLNFKNKTNLAAFTLDFAQFGSKQNESTLAHITAKKFNLKHQVFTVDQDDTDLMLDDFFESMDQPSIDGLNVWMISKFASQAGYRAVLSGLGGDEILAGYPSFKSVPQYSKFLKLARGLNHLGMPIKKMANAAVMSKMLHPKMKGFTTSGQFPFYDAYQLKRSLFLDQEISEILELDDASYGHLQIQEIDFQESMKVDQLSNNYLKVSALEINNYMKNQLLRDSDWASMYHSLELRVPFVDLNLIRVCASELSKMNKPNKHSLVQNIYKDVFPKQVLAKKKTGFETPAKIWLDTKPELRHWKDIQSLGKQNCPWARKWAYEVKTRFLN